MEAVVILIVALLIFGPKNLPKLGKSIGMTAKGFREGLEEGEREITHAADVVSGREPLHDGSDDTVTDTDTVADEPVQEDKAEKPAAIFCTACGAENEPGSAFCKSCGAKLVEA
jgi:sec-independent protein translocase protein TatA